METVNNLIYLHDGAPAHNDLRVKNDLDILFPGRWIGRGGAIPWPPRSPDLNCCDFYLWGRIKNMVYQGDTSTREATWQRIQDAFASLQPEEITRATQDVYQRVRLCAENDGRHFEQL